MPSREPITREFLLSIFDYYPDTGMLFWRARTDVRKEWNTRYAGTLAGRTCKGHIEVSIHKVRYQTHRLIYVMMTGSCPAEIDHRDNDGSNNRWLNLRPSEHYQNLANRPAQANNECGLKGVYWATREERWIAQISVRGRHIHIGSYKTREEAAKGYAEAASLHFGEFANSQPFTGTAPG